MSVLVRLECKIARAGKPPPDGVARNSDHLRRGSSANLASNEPVRARVENAHFSFHEDLRFDSLALQFGLKFEVVDRDSGLNC